MRKRTNRILPTLMAVILVIAAMVIPVAAATSATDQMAANSAAWWVAYRAGDTATCNALHEANVALANQAAGSGGTATYNPSGGNWTITTSSGSTIRSTGSSSGKNTTVSYTTTGSNGQVSQSSASSYKDSAISAYLSNGGTKQGLINSYNAAADKNSSNHGYTDRAETLTADSEISLVKALFDLTDEEAVQLERDLEESKAAYVQARDVYEAALRTGDSATAAAAKAQMDAAHRQAEETRGKYGYTGDSDEFSDGAFFYGGETSAPAASSSNKPSSTHTPTPSPTPSPTPTPTPTFVPVYKITASAGEGGTISPPGVTNVRKGSSQSYTITPDEGFEIQSVTVDGVDKGARENYTFSNVTEAHTITASFTASGHVELGEPEITDDQGHSISGGAENGSIKSGYGIFAKVPVSYAGVTDLKLTMTYNFGQGSKTVVLKETRTGSFEYPVNSQSPSGKRCVYIPVETMDGSYTLTFTLTAKDSSGAELTDSKTATVAVLGSMYEDDFVGDS